MFTISMRGLFRFRSYHTGQFLGKAVFHKKGDVNMTSSPRGMDPKTLKILVNSDNHVWTWNPLSGRDGSMLKKNTAPILSALTPDGDAAIVTTPYDHLEVWNLPTLTRVRSFVYHPVHYMTALTNNIIAAVAHKTIYVTNIHMGSNEYILNVNSVITALQCVNGNIVAASVDGTIRIWDRCSGNILQSITIGKVVHYMLPYDYTIYCITTDGHMGMLDLRTNLYYNFYDDRREISITAVDVLSNGVMVQGLENGTIVTRDIDGKKMGTFKAHCQQVKTLLALPDNKLLSGDGYTLTVWE